MGIVSTIPESAADYVMYGDKSHIVSDYLRGQLERVPQVFNQFTQRIYEAVQQSYNYVTDGLIRHGIMNHLGGQGIRITDDYIRALRTFEEIQQAEPTMQRWIMSHPEVKQLYLDQNVDGYSDTYVNTFGTGVAEDDYNWRRVMSGIEQDDGVTSKVTVYEDDLYDGDSELDFYKQSEIIETYRALSVLLVKQKYDFTLKSEALMKINRE